MLGGNLSKPAAWMESSFWCCRRCATTLFVSVHTKSHFRQWKWEALFWPVPGQTRWIRLITTLRLVIKYCFNLKVGKNDRNIFKDNVKLTYMRLELCGLQCKIVCYFENLATTEGLLHEFCYYGPSSRIVTFCSIFHYYYNCPPRHYRDGGRLV